jgi:hypothetical protein
VAVGPEVGVVGLLRGKKKRGIGWAAGLERRKGGFGLVVFLFLFQPFTHKIFSSFQKLF